MIYKICSRCKIEKNINEFYISTHSGFADGYTSRCKQCILECGRKYSKDNREKRNLAMQEWRAKNIDKSRSSRNKSQRKRNAKRLPADLVANAIRSKIHRQLTTGKGGKKTFQLLGYTPSELMKHLEKQFSDGMTWGNYGQWHIDHKIPKSVFNITSYSDIDFLKCWALKNLQPLWARDNLAKGAKLDRDFQPSLNISLEVAQ